MKRVGNHSRFLVASVMAALFMAAQHTDAAFYNVFAAGNSSSGGTPLSTIILTAGQLFSVSVSPTDIWSAGALPRWSNADGLIADLYATGIDESGQSAGTRIGAAFPQWTQDGFTAPYGALVGYIGGNYILLGTSYTGSAPVSGTLQLMYWDENGGDNADRVTASVSAVPEPSTVIGAALLLLPLLANILRVLRKSRMA